MVYFILIIILLICFIANTFRRPSNYPPGPKWLPFVGNLFELKKLSRTLGGQHKALYQLSIDYNTDLLGLKLGNEYVIVASSFKLIKKILTSNEYNSRPDNFFIRLRCMGKKKGITCTDGQIHSIQKNFVLRHLRDLGFGKTNMEIMIKDEINDVINYLKINNCNICIGKLLSISVLNILWSLVSGYRFSKTDNQLNKILDLLEKRSKAFDMSGGILSQYPWLRYLIPERSGFNLIKRLNFELNNFIMQTINDHIINWTMGRTDDLIYSFINEMKMQSDNSTFNIEQLVMICLDIFIAGSQTTSNTLDFAFLFMIIYPDIQDKIHKEIDKYLNNGCIEYSDRNKLPYVEAYLLEIERYVNIIPITGPRKVITDIYLDNYLIPKDTTILLNYHAMYHDKDYWKDPELFRPERFLSEDGKVISNEILITFGIGKRRCIGEILARCCIFQFFVAIMRQFKIESTSNEDKPKYNPLPGITKSPGIYMSNFIPRE